MEGGAWQAKSTGSHRVGHDGSTLARTHSPAPSHGASPRSVTSSLPSPAQRPSPFSWRARIQSFPAQADSPASYSRGACLPALPSPLRCLSLSCRAGGTPF